MVLIKQVDTPGENLSAAIQLFKAYRAALGVDLNFQNFDEEIDHPLQKYGPPQGALFIAFLRGEPIGCIALQQLPNENKSRVCEMKRLYVKPENRKDKAGYLLVEKLIEKAIQLGYNIMKLDTLEHLQPAIKLYEKFGFTITTSYYNNPLPGVVYMEKQL